MRKADKNHGSSILSYLPSLYKMPENEKENSHHRGDSGIEKATAELFTEQGANVVISDIQEDEGRGTSGNIINTTDHA